ncbi:MAG TPA: N-acetyl sugar amidotransferase [Bacteroidales bacterium]|nr:N-acetyl sugar amidotransferase [Bacteroidales bacterium]HUM33540.1 N-acetyl sugar amidotransferase [Bacteroidales bacterium]
MKRDYQICNYCVMDTTDEDIIFDENGRCNHCKDFEQTLEKIKIQKQNTDYIDNLIKKVKSKNKKYDSIVGISGGVDSCYTLYLCVKWGLKPLAVHMDNGWNSEIAVTNVKRIVKKLGVDYISYVLNWEEFREIQKAFLKSSIVDIEMPTDIAIAASLYETAAKNKIKYIISGGNYSAEGILPLTWGYHVLKDLKIYKHIIKKYSDVKIKTVPIVGLRKEIYYKFFKRIKYLYPLNYIDYNKDEAREFLKIEFDWQDYGGKHHESRITGFWQSYVMPVKYNMDYRRATLSSQIVSGQITRNKALQILENLPYNPEKIEIEKNYIAKKYGISRQELDKYLNLPPKTYKNFPNQKKLIMMMYDLYRSIIK